MTPVLILLAVVVTAGGVMAVSAREPRLVALGTLIALVGSAYVADPVPGPATLGVRLVGTVLGAYLTWIALRGSPLPRHERAIGWPGAAAVGIIAFASGWMAAATLAGSLAGGGGEGPSAGIVAPALVAGSSIALAAVAAAFALAAMAAVPVLLGHDVLHIGAGLLLLVAAATLVRNALSTAFDPAAEVALAVLVAAAGAGVAAAIRASLRAVGDLDIRPHALRETPVHHRTADDAHHQPTP